MIRLVDDGSHKARSKPIAFQESRQEPPESSAQPASQELRIALALNGGISLAVWIGGLVREFDRLRNREGRVYPALLELIQSEPVLDVIAGASAGGVNGVALAYAMAHGRAVERLENLWVEGGAFDQLLREPLDSDPPSILQGDGYFLDAIVRGLDSIATSGRRSPQGPRNVDLTVTTTLLDAQEANLHDDLGQLVRNARYDGLLRFGDASVDAVGDLLDLTSMSRAARSTASFPVAFEPHAFAGDGEAENTLPGQAADKLATAASFSRHNHLLDGGILDNKPIEPALQAILRREREGDVRRVLAYVVPGGWDDATASTIDPTMAGVTWASLSTIPRYQSISEQVARIRQHNDDVKDARAARAAIVASLLEAGGGETPGDAARAVAMRLYPAYARQREAGLARILATRLDDALGDFQGTSRAVPGGARQYTSLGARGPLERRLFEDARFSAVPAALPQAEALGGPWRFGITTLGYLRDVTTDLLRVAQRHVPVSAEGDFRRDIASLWRELYDQAAILDSERGRDAAVWTDAAQAAARRASTVAPTDLGRRALDLADLMGEEVFLRLSDRESTSALESRRDVAFALARIIGNVQEVLSGEAAATRDAGTVRSRRSSLVDELRDAERIAEFLAGAGDKDRDEASILARFVALEVAQFASGAGARRPDATVEFVEFSAEGASPLGGSAKVGEKLAGTRLAAFAAFYRRSWRSNDWMVGRLDGARRLALVLLDPDRLDRLYPRSIHDGDEAGGAAQVLAAIERIVTAPDATDPAWTGRAADELREELRSQWAENLSAVEEELAFLDDPTIPVPPSLPTCARLIAYRLHLEEIAPACLAAIASSVAYDVEHGAASVGPSADFARTYAAQAAHGWPSVSAVTSVFASNRIGEEEIGQDVPSALFSATASQTLAVVAAAAGGKHSGLGPFRSLFSAARAPLLVTYVLSRADARRSALVNAMLAALLGASATAVTLALLAGKALPSAVMGLGLAGLLGALVWALLRTMRLAQRLLAPIIVLLLVGLGVWYAASAWLRVEVEPYLVYLERGLAILGFGLVSVWMISATSAVVRGRRRDSGKQP